jgi:hypothetical protein
MGRELFALMRAQVGTAEQGGSALFIDEEANRAAARPANATSATGVRGG